MKIKTLEGDMQTSEGDYIIKGLRGEFYPCKPDVFEKKYELSEQTDNDNQKGMTEEEKNILSDSLDKLSSEKCEIEMVYLQHAVLIVRFISMALTVENVRLELYLII